MLLSESACRNDSISGINVDKQNDVSRSLYKSNAFSFEKDGKEDLIWDNEDDWEIKGALSLSRGLHYFSQCVKRIPQTKAWVS